MTVEECNGRLEGKAGGDLKHEGVDDVGGAFMIINGLSEKDHNFGEGKEEEVDPASFGEVDNGGGEVAVVKEMEEKNGDGGSLRGNGEDEDLVSSVVPGEKNEAMESSSGAAVEKEESLGRSADAVDDEVEREASDVEAQILSEESDVKVEGGGLVMDADNYLESSSVEEVAGADSGRKGESGVAVDRRSESDVDVAETDSLVESKVAVTEDILESEVIVADTDSPSESEVAVAETDSRGESEVAVANTNSQQKSEVTVADTDSRPEWEVADADTNSQQESEVAVADMDSRPGSAVADTNSQQEPEVTVPDTDSGPESEVTVVENDSQQESEVAVADTDNQPESEVTVASTDSRPESEVSFAHMDSLPESEVSFAHMDRRPESEVASIETDSRCESEVVVAENDIRQESEDVATETDSQPESEVVVVESDRRQESEDVAAETDSRRESKVVVLENDSQQESEVDVAEANRQAEKELPVEVDGIKESETKVGGTVGNSEQKQEDTTGSLVSEEHVIEETDNAKVKEPETEPEQIDNSEVQGLEPEPEPELSVFDNHSQKEAQSRVEVEVKESEIEVSGADYLSSVSESGEPVIQETQRPETLVAEGEKVGASEVDTSKVEEQKEAEPCVEEICMLSEFRSAAAAETSQTAVMESNISESLPVENDVDGTRSSEVDRPTYEPSNISESLPLESEVDEMQSSTTDAPTYQSSNSQATNVNGESDSIDYDAPTAEKDENLEVDESNGCTNERETVTVTEKEPEEIKTKIAPEKEPEEDTTDATTEATLEIAVIKRHHIFMIKVPRFANDEQLQKKLQQAVSQLEEKTRFRDSVQEEIRKSMVVIDQDNKEIAAASANENAARLKYNAKRKEVEGVQVLLNRINCAVSIADIDEKIKKMVHMQQHETIALRQEKQYIHEINQLKRLREQLSLKSSSQEQTDNALFQRSEIERQFENLKKELAPINDMWRSAKDRKQTAWKRCNDEKDLLRNLREVYQVANGIRQEAYVRLLELRKQATDKFKHFGMYKADQNAVATYRFSGDNEGLGSHCDRQVERIMELWNNNDDFRKEYMKSNVNSTLRRLGTLDGRSLGLDEDPPAIISHLDKRPNNLYVLASRTDTPTSEVKQEFPETQELASTNHRSGLRSSEICDHQEPQKEVEKESKLEELAELARKEEQLRKEMASAKENEVAAELKEKLILEQKARAKDAEERKKRKEEKNKTKSDQRAQKEAELKEEKKAKKEMKRASFTSSNGDRDGQTVSMTDIPSTSQGGAETTSPTPKRRYTRVTVAAKQDRVHPLPLALRNRGRRKMTTWLWVTLIAISALLILLAGYYLSF